MLNESLLQEIIKKRPRKSTVDTGRLLGERLRFHTDAIVDNQYTSGYYSKYLKYVFSFIEDEVKRERFKTFLNNPPLPTVEVSEKIWRKRDRIFNTSDFFEKIEFSRPELEEEAKDYLDSINFEEFFKDLNEYRKTSPNSFWVVDLPILERNEEGNIIGFTGQLEPYPYIIDINYVIDYLDTPNGLKHLIYKCDDKIVAIDKMNYFVIPLDEDGEPNYSQMIVSEHSTGKCPAGQLSNQSLLKQDYQVKGNLVVNQLSALDTFLFTKISKKYLDSYMFPIIQKVEEACDYRDMDGNECTGGTVYYERWCPDDSYEGGGYNEKREKECPTCKANKIIGAGSVVITPAPDGEIPIINDAVKFVTPQVDYLDYAKETIKEFEDSIIANSVGVLSDQNKQQNELQVQAGFEDRRDILLDETKEMSRLRSEIISCIMTYCYGDTFIKTVTNYGTEYYLATIVELEERKKLAIDNGASQSELMQLQQRLIETEHRNNPTLIERLKMLLHLEPFPLMSIEKANNILQNGNISVEYLEKKILFDKLVRKFEREQGAITEFISDAPFEDRIDLIDKILNEYLNEERRNDVREQGPETGTPVPSQREV